MTQVVLSRYGQGSWIFSRASLNSFTEYTIEPRKEKGTGYFSDCFRGRPRFWRVDERPSVVAVVVRRSVSSKGCCRLTQLRGTSRNTRESRRRGRERRTDGRQDESPCTCNACPPKGLARRSQRDQHGFHSMRGEVSELGRIVAKRRARNFLLTGLGAIRNRACVSVLPTAEIPENWRLLDEDDGN